VIRTDRLLLIPAVPEMMLAELEGTATLAAALGMAVPGTKSPESFDAKAVPVMLERLSGHPEKGGWWLHNFVPG
jgi:hypothetical protein